MSRSTTARQNYDDASSGQSQTISKQKLTDHLTTGHSAVYVTS